MLPIERQNAIVELVNKDGAVKVKDLAARFGVTEDCIRKDLTQLERQKLVKKSRGGAVPARLLAGERYVAERKVRNLEAKQAIAQRALGLISDGDFIFLDNSTANVQLAQLIAESGKRVTVVTGSIDVILALRSSASVKLIALGGELNAQGDCFVGPIANEQLAKYRFDLAFIGVVGVDLEGDRVSTLAPADGSTKARAIAASTKCYLMLETRKFDEDGTYWYAHVSDFTGAVLEAKPAPKLRKLMDEYVVEWLF